MKPLAASVRSHAGSPASRRPMARIRGIAPAALLVGGLFTVWAGPLAAPVAATAPTGQVVAWGYDASGQTNVPAGLSGVTAIAAGDNFSLALKADGTVVAWGDDTDGQTDLPAGLSGVTAIAAGANFGLALKADGTVVPWGALDDSTAGISGVTAIAAGRAFDVAMKSDGTVIAWGLNAVGQTNVPAGLSGVTAIAAGEVHSLALKSDGTVIVWGQNASGVFDPPAGLAGVVAIAAGGDAVTVDGSLALKSDGTVVAWGPIAGSVPADLSGVTAIAAGGRHSLALKADGSVVGWGHNELGQTTIPAGLTGVTAIAAGEYHSLALVAPPVPDAVAWGSDDHGQTEVPAGLAGVKAIAGGMWHSVALKSDGSIVGWGYGTDGELDVPALPTGVRYTAIAAGGHHTLALRSDGTAVAWGWAGYEGWNITTVPAPPGGTYSVYYTAVAAEGNHSLALLSDGTVVAWGDNQVGQSAVPVGLSGVKAIAAGSDHDLALKSDGTVVAWGNNGNGQIDVPSDLQSAGTAHIVAIAAGGGHSLALKSDGTIVGWGASASGQLGVPSCSHCVKAISAGGDNSLALISDGTVFASGDNSHGQTTIPDGLSGVIAIAAGYAHSLALEPAITTHLSVSGILNPYPAGSKHSVKVKALDAYGNVATSYRGTIHFTTSDTTAGVPADYTFTEADAGVHTFSSSLSPALTLKTAGSRWVCATDKTTAAITGSQTVTVTPGAAKTLAVSGILSSYPAGSKHSVKVTARDAYGNVAQSYRGTIHFTSSDTQATVPADYSFTSGDSGVHTFASSLSPALTLKPAGSRWVRATDNAKATITGAQTGIVVTPGTAKSFKVAVGVNPWPAGSSHSVKVTVLDAYGNVATAYRGLIFFTTSDTQASVPAAYTFTATAGGVHTFPTTISPKLTFKTAGTQWLRVADFNDSRITGVQTGIVVQ